MSRQSSSCLVALIALTCAWPLTGCGEGDDGGSGSKSEAAASGRERSGASSEASSPSHSGHHAGGGSGSASDSAPAVPSTTTETSPDQQSFGADLQHPKKSHKSPKTQSSGKSGSSPTAGMTPQEAATYETARALCANPATLQYAPEEIRDDAEALAKFAEGFAPAGEEQVVHDGCLVGLKSIGIG
jgi:hypothetical protein